MNEALIRWMMVPGAEEVPLRLEDFLHRPGWHQRAACRGAGVAAFVIPHGSQYGPTRALCDGCPVRQECLEVAMAGTLLDGLWGGTTPTERKAMRRARVARVIAYNNVQ